VKDQLDPLIFKPDDVAAGQSPELGSEPPPSLSWGTAPSSLPPPSVAPVSPASAVHTLPRVNTPRGILAPGSQFGVYRVGPCIGEGGMARVYQAEHSGLQRQVALKVLTEGAVGTGDESRERFLREARIAAAVKHPNVVNIFDVGVHDGTPFLVMELLSGIDLETLIATQGALDESFLVDIMIPIVAGLATVHDAGVVHRDLKPGNIFLGSGRYEEIEPKLLDFGISKQSGAEPLRMTSSGLLMGTPFYMSPEGLRGEEMTPKADQYSLGVLMYECATGQNPFNAPSFAEIFQLIGSATFVAPTVLKPQLSKRFERIVLRAMSLDPADRFTDLRELGRELLLLSGQRTRVTWALSFGDVPRTTLANALPVAKPPPRKARPRRLWAVFAALLLLLIAFVIWLDFGDSPPPDPAHIGANAPSSMPVSAPAPERGESAIAPTAPTAPALAPAPLAAARPEPKRKRVWVAPKLRDEGPDHDLQWVLPSQPASAPAKPSVRTGANGAPIFD
jgi:eukaryotic-like serine/threonine-protein kinase